MKIERFTIPIYEYDVIYIELHSDDTIDEQIKLVTDELIALKTDQKYTDEVIQDIKDERKNGGNHFYNLSRKISLILIDPHDDPERLRCTIAHEKRHLEDRMLEHYIINDIESAGLLSGYLARFIH